MRVKYIVLLPVRPHKLVRLDKKEPPYAKGSVGEGVEGPSFNLFVKDILKINDFVNKE
jgi:hypothetical protein